MCDNGTAVLELFAYSRETGYEEDQSCLDSPGTSQFSPRALLKYDIHVVSNQRLLQHNRVRMHTHVHNVIRYVQGRGKPMEILGG